MKCNLTRPQGGAHYEGETEIDRVWSRVRKEAEHWIWTGSFTRGAPQAQREGYNQPVRRVFWTMAYGELAEGQRVRMHSGEPRCVRLSHIEIEQPAVVA